MGKIIFTDFKAKKVEMVVENNEFELFTTTENNNVDYSAGLRLVSEQNEVNAPAQLLPSKRDYLTPLFEAISTSDEVMSRRGYFNLNNYKSKDKLFINSVEISLEKLKRAQVLINEQVFLMQELLKDSQVQEVAEERKPGV